MSEFDKKFPKPTHETFYSLTIALMLRSVAKNAWLEAKKDELNRIEKIAETQISVNPNVIRILLETEIAELEKEKQ